jgi:hypothetical protein
MVLQGSDAERSDKEVTVGVPSNGSGRSNGTGASPQQTAPAGVQRSERAPRRMVLLDGAEDSAVQQVLAEYQGDEVSGKRIHADVQRFAGEHRGRYVAVEWLGPLGWTRFLWCRK